MINTSEIINSKENYNKTLTKLFNSQKKSRIKFIRLATHFKEVSEVVKICKFLKNKNYKVIINLMQITEQSNKNVIDAIKKIKKVNRMMVSSTVWRMNSRCFRSIIYQNLMKGEIGRHTHNIWKRSFHTSLLNGVTS